MIITQKIKKHADLTLVLYLLCLIWIIALKCNMRIAVTDSIIGLQKYNLAERITYFLGKFSPTSPEDAVINILLFVPAGLLFPFFFKKSAYIKSGIIALALTLGFEIFQLITRIGGFTYIDIICNFLGGFLGCEIHSRLIHRANENTICKACKIISVIGAMILAFAIVNTIINIDIYFV